MVLAINGTVTPTRAWFFVEVETEVIFVFLFVYLRISPSSH